MTPINMKLRRFATQFQYSMLALVLISVCPWRALARLSPQEFAAQMRLKPLEQSEPDELSADAVNHLMEKVGWRDVARERETQRDEHSRFKPVLGGSHRPRS